MEDTGKRKSKHKDIAERETGEKVIPVIREEVVVDRKLVRKASILVQKKISMEEIDLNLPLKEESYDIEHVQKNQYLDSHPEIRYEGDTIIVPVVKEVLIKKLLLTEEIRITKKVMTKVKEEKVSLRKEEVETTRNEEQE